MPQIKLTYFDTPGRAEPLRVALFLSDVPFEDHRLKFPEFMAAKSDGSLPLSSVPVLEIDGFKYTQTGAMLRYVATLGDNSLYPTDPTEAFIVDSALDTVNDTVANALMPSLFERDEAKKLQMRADFANGVMARSFAYLETLLDRTKGPFFGGSNLTIADLVTANNVMTIRKGILDGVTVEHMEAYPLINAMTDAYLADPGVTAYYEAAKG